VKEFKTLYLLLSFFAFSCSRSYTSDDFDSLNPDTDLNQIHFKNFLKVDITPDVKNIYCFADELGADASYLFSFNCDQQTANKIIKANKLVLDTADREQAVSIQENGLKWWDTNITKTLPFYKWSGDRYYKYFWYDKNKNRGYFMDFDT
jgi:hypothetical protein